MKNVLIDKQVSWLADDEHRELLKDFDKSYVVGIDLKQTSFDENCASFCLDGNCDFLTADAKAYTHFFKINKIKSVEISRFMRDKDPERFVYLMQIKT
ncbi:MAG: hypothetical protein QQN46_07610 [Nitrosopumilus sp.]